MKLNCSLILCFCFLFFLNAFIHESFLVFSMLLAVVEDPFLVAFFQYLVDNLLLLHHFQIIRYLLLFEPLTLAFEGATLVLFSCGGDVLSALRLLGSRFRLDIFAYIFRIYKPFQAALCSKQYGTVTGVWRGQLLGSVICESLFGVASLGVLI